MEDGEVAVVDARIEPGYGARDSGAVCAAQVGVSRRTDAKPGWIAPRVGTHPLGPPYRGTVQRNARRSKRCGW